MTKDKKNQETRADAVELEEAELDNVTGGALDHVGQFNFKVEINGVKPRLTEAAGIRATDGTKIRAGIRATDGTKIRK